MKDLSNTELATRPETNDAPDNGGIADPNAPSPGWSSPLIARVLVTVAVVVLYLVARRIPLFSVTPTPRFEAEHPAIMSLMSLGVNPLLMGYLLVEWAAVIVPGWRPLRVGGPAARAGLHRASIRIGILLAAGQALVLVLGLEQMGMAREAGPVWNGITVLTLAGMTSLLAVAARIVEQHGLGGGFAVLLLADLLSRIIEPLSKGFAAAHYGSLASKDLLTNLVAITTWVLATLWMFSARRLPMRETENQPRTLERPACGVVPLTLVPAVLAFASRAVSLHQPGFRPNYTDDTVVTLILTLVAAALLTIVFNQRSRVLLSWNRLSPSSTEIDPRPKSIVLESVLYVLLLAGLEAWACR